MLDRLEHRAFEVEHARDLGGEADGLPVQQRVGPERLQLGIARVDERVERVLVPHDVQRGVSPAVRIDRAEDPPGPAGRAGGIEPAHERVGVRGPEPLSGERLGVQPEEVLERVVVIDLERPLRLADSRRTPSWNSLRTRSRSRGPRCGRCSGRSPRSRPSRRAASSSARARSSCGRSRSAAAPR